MYQPGFPQRSRIITQTAKIVNNFFEIFSLIFVVQHAVAEAGKFGVGNLFSELFADTLIFLCTLQAAGAVSAGTLYAGPDHLDHFLVIIDTNCHI